MKFKNKILSLGVLLCTSMMTLTESCQKYPDGPMISLRSRTERVANTWKVDNYKINGNDFTSLMGGYTETYTKDGNYSFAWGNLSGTGKWEFQNKDAEIRITGTNNAPSQTLFIQKLEEKQFWYYYMDGNDKKEMHLIQN